MLFAEIWAFVILDFSFSSFNRLQSIFFPPVAFSGISNLKDQK
nr:MAG TPA: hypothetical protein [Caudoviricetes sp.]